MSVQKINYKGQYSPQPNWVGQIQGIDTVQEWLEYPLELCSVADLPYAKNWSKEADNLIKDKVEKLDKKMVKFCYRFCRA